MIVLDLDGTLTNEKKEITAKTYNSLMQAQQQGVKIVLASGRPTYGIVPRAPPSSIKNYHRNWCLISMMKPSEPDFKSSPIKAMG